MLSCVAFIAFLPTHRKYKSHSPEINDKVDRERWFHTITAYPFPATLSTPPPPPQFPPPAGWPNETQVERKWKTRIKLRRLVTRLFGQGLKDKIHLPLHTAAINSPISFPCTPLLPTAESLQDLGPVA